MADDQELTISILEKISVASGCKTCPKPFFNLLNSFVNSTKFQDYELLNGTVQLYNKLQKEHIDCKRKHSDLVFCAIYFIDFFDFLQQFVFTFDVTIGLDFPIIVADMHNKLDLAWRTCPHCSKIKYLE